MSTEPLYPAYLPVKPEGFTPTLDIQTFATDEPSLRADPSLLDILTPKTTLKSITPHVGTEIRSLQLSQLTPAGLDQVALLVAQRGILVFQDQGFADIGPERQLEIAKHFDPLHKVLCQVCVHDVEPELIGKTSDFGISQGHWPEFQVVYADEKVGNLRDLLGSRTNYDLWHVEQTFTPNTPGTPFFWVLEMPASGGGDTASTSLTTAYKALSPTFREGLHRLKLPHTSASVGEVARVGQERDLKEAVKTEHPLVISHPVVEHKPSESDLLLGFLHDHIRFLDFSCRVSWEKRTVVVWDQRTVAHSAVPDFADGERRHMFRIIPYGSQPQPL
ncbi:hypothetical protein BDV06DRAFT_234457 [Aspergillus oleicola]